MTRVKSERRTGSRWLPALLMALIMLTGAVGCGLLSGWNELSRDEVRELFSGSVVKGHHETLDYEFKSYYSRDGSFRSEQGPEKIVREGNWWTTSDGRMCILWDAEPEELCREIETDGEGRYRKVLGNKVIASYEEFLK